MHITEQKTCRICGNDRLVPVLDLGSLAMTGIFPSTVDEDVFKGPLKLVKCHDRADCCGLVQLAHNYDLSEMYGDRYGYRSGLNKSMVSHLFGKVTQLLLDCPVSPGDIVLDIGSNDGTTLGFYPDDVVRLGIDPTTEKFRKFHPPGITAVADFFTAETFRRAVGDRKAKIVTSISMFYDLPSPMDFVKDVASILADDGVWHLEQSYLPSMLKTNSYDTVCHEHVEYYGLEQIQWMTSRAGLKIVDVKLNNVNGGSFALTVMKGTEDCAVVQHLLGTEKFLTSLESWKIFAETVAQHKIDLPKRLLELKEQGKKVCGLGASTKGNVVLQYCGITPDLLPMIAEVNPDKFGCFTPGSQIPICSEAHAATTSPDVYLVFPWHFKAGFVAAQKDFIKRGGSLMFPLPTISIS